MDIAAITGRADLLQVVASSRQRQVAAIADIVDARTDPDRLL
jgi:hypothetical protein